MSTPAAWPTRRVPVAILVALACSASVADSPAAHIGVDVVAVAHATPRPDWVPLIHVETGRPYRLLDPHLTVAIAPSVTEHLSHEWLAAGLTVFNDVPGSAVEVVVTAEVDTADIGVVVVPCRRLPGGNLGRVRLHVDAVDAHAAWVDTARIEVCPRLAERSRHFVRHLVAHELAHVLGLGHLCLDPGCWPLDRRPQPCEFMYPSVHPCQDIDIIRADLPTLYPDEDADQQRREDARGKTMPDDEKMSRK
jgi:hypothetical protein